MVDITKCANADCPMKESCYRAQAKDGEMQSFQRFEYTLVNVDGLVFPHCDFYIKAVDTTK